MNEPRRPWLQFRLRSLLVSMLVVAAFFAGRMSGQRELLRQRAMVEEAYRAQERALVAERTALIRATFVQSQSQAATLGFQRQTGLEPVPQAREEAAPPSTDGEKPAGGNAPAAESPVTEAQPAEAIERP